MALALTLTQAGTSLQHVQVKATCTLAEVNGVPRITTMELNVRGNVSGVDAAGFEKVARQAEQLCPVSNALRNNVSIRLQAHLKQ